MDWPTFRNFVLRAQAGDETVPASVAARVNAAVLAGERNPAERDRRWWLEFWLRQALQESVRKLDDLIDRYRQIADWHREEAEKARERMRQAADRLADADAFITDVDDIFNARARAGRLDRDKALKALRGRGINFHPDVDEGVLLAELARQKEAALVERRQSVSEFESANGDATRHEESERENRRKAEELIGKRDAIRNSGCDADEELRRLNQAAEEYEADVRLKADEIEKEKLSAPARSDGDEALRSTVKSTKTQDEEADFLASLNNLSSTFASSAANVVTRPNHPGSADGPKPPVPAGPAFNA
jgi:DNA repair exonuclease SbcCD ATPase subunit